MRPPVLSTTSRRFALVPFFVVAMVLRRSTDQQTCVDYIAQKSSSVVHAFSLAPIISSRAAIKVSNHKRITSRCWSSPMNKEQDEKEEESVVQRTSFDQAGKSLVEEEDKKRLDEMGDFDSNPNVRC